MTRLSLARLRARWPWLGTANHHAKERQRRLLHGLLIIGLAVLPIVALLNAVRWFATSSPHFIHAIAFDFLLALFFLSLLRLNRARHLPWAGYLVLTIAVLSLAATTPIAELDRILVAYAVPTIAASFVIAPAASFAFAGLSALSYAVAYWAGGAPGGYNYLAWPVLLVVALVSCLVADRLEEALREARQSQESLQETIHALQAVVQASPVPIMALDPDGNVIMWNPAAERVFGWSEAEVLGRFNPLVSEEKKAEHDALRARVLRGESFTDVEVRRRKKDGSPVDISLSTAPLRNAQGDIIGAVAVMTDITERKRMEESLRRQNEYLAALHETALGLMNHLELSGLLEAILTRASQLLGTQHGFLYVAEPGGEHLTLKVAIGIHKKQIGARLRAGEGLSGKVWQSGQPLVVDDYSTWPGRALQFDDLIHHAVVGVPLKAGPQVVGVLGLTYVEPGRSFGKAEVELLNRFAQLASIALDNARLLQDEREQRELAEVMRETATTLSATLDSDVILDTLLEQVARVVPYDSACVMLIEDGRARVVRARGYERYGEEEGRVHVTASFDLATTPNLRHMVESRQSLVIPDTAAYPGWIQRSEHIRAWAGAPIVVDGDVAAVFSLDKTERGFYRPEHAKRLAIFAAQAGLALRNARLFEETKRHLQEVSLLSWVIALTATADDMTTAL